MDPDQPKKRHGHGDKSKHKESKHGHGDKPKHKESKHEPFPEPIQPQSHHRDRREFSMVPYSDMHKTLSNPELATQPKPIYVTMTQQKPKGKPKDIWNDDSEEDDKKALPEPKPLPKFDKAIQHFKEYTQKHGKGHGLRLARFGIPDSKELLDLLLNRHRTHISACGKNIWYYTSPILRNKVPINMRGRYRGTKPSETCMKAIDILKLNDKETEKKEEDERKAHLEGDPYEALKSVSLNDEHFQFLKETAEAQLTTLPVTILATLISDVVPILGDTYRVYANQFGEKNFKTKDVAKGYFNSLHKHKMFTKM